MTKKILALSLGTIACLATVNCGGTGKLLFPYGGLLLYDAGMKLTSRNGGTVTTVTDNSNFLGSLASNGRIFTSQYLGAGPTSEIVSMNPDASDQVRLTTNSEDDFRPIASVNGNKVVFISKRDGNFEIYIMNSDGSNQVRLTNNASPDYFPAISADGTKVVFTSERDGGDDDIFIINSDGTGLTQLTFNNVEDTTPSFSPDGSKIVFSSKRDASEAELYIMNVNGSNVVRLTNNSEYEYHASFDVYGNYIYFYTPTTLNRCAADGSQNAPLFNAPYQKSAGWVY